MFDDEPWGRRRRRYAPSGVEKQSYSGGSDDLRQTTSDAPKPASNKDGTSSYLTRLAKTSSGDAKYEGGGKVDWISRTSADSSPASANLQSRLRWMETAFKKKDGHLQPVQQTPVQQISPYPNNRGDIKTAVEGMKKRVQNIISELQSVDKELSDLEQKIT